MEVQQVDKIPDVDLVFTKADLKDVVPHDNDPMVILLVIAGRRVHRVLVDQGSLADVMFLTTFNQLQSVKALHQMFVWVCRGPSGGSWAHRVEDDVHGWRNFAHYQHQVPRC